MTTPQEIQRSIEEVSAKGTQQAFLQRLLIDALQWPIDPNARVIEDSAFEWSAEELKAGDLSKKIVENRIWQIQTNPAAPWGIFLLEFANAEAFATDRGMTGPLRAILRGLVPKGRASAAATNRPAWKREHLLFICTHKYKHFRFAYFKAPEGQTKTAPLAFFGWSPDVPARTACEHNLPHLQWPSKLDPASFTEAWDDAFNVEKVTKKFYEDYRAVFEATERAVGKENGIKGEELRLYTQSLFNRLMFLRFIERKGWLKFGNSKDYLRTVFAAGPIGTRSFFQARLKLLFFEGLAKEHDNPSDDFGDVPFLNGGLFEAGELDEKVKDIPDAIFTPILDAQRGLFYRYNFTVEESTPLDIEVAVDPEMLGKVFEELVTGRHESGSYYTPRPVVSFMCREALKGYLAHSNKASESAIEALVDDHEVKGLTESHARDIIASLDKLKAVDPACGSGAYLLGLLHELLTIYRLLYSEKLLRDSRSLYELKLRIISHNLYGVDIDPFATSIAMLRLWLSLAVDSDDAMPLPNLEFKIETGDSVCGPDPQPPKKGSGTSDIFDARLASIADDLVNLKERYLTAHGIRKTEFKTVIQQRETEIAHDLRLLRAKNIIMWRVQFAEAFSKNGGFDIVLANPPYIRQELIKDLKPALKKVYGEEYSGTADLYIFFYLRALQLLTQGGMLVFISSNKWFRAGYGEKLRALFGKTASVQTIVDFHDLPVFESAIAYPMIFIAAKVSPSASPASMLAEPPNLDPPYPDITAVVAKFGQRLPVTALGKDGTWHLASSTQADLLKKMRLSGPALIKYVDGRIYRGLLTGLNAAWVDSKGRVYTKGDKRPTDAIPHGVFVIDDNTRKELIRQDPKSAEIIKALAVGRDIKRWRVESRDVWMIITRIGVDIKRYPAVFKHLKIFQKALEEREDQGQHWWELRACAYYEVFEKPKIVYQEIATYQGFAFDRVGFYFNNKAFLIDSDDRYLLAVLNSKSAWRFLHEIAQKMVGGAFAMQLPYVGQIPIPDAPIADRTAITTLAQKCLDASGVDCEAWEHEIDERVAALYDIDLKDITLADNGGKS